ncbi:MAG TPA: DUF4388 domain-containing protein [Vicinamibacteria bacterium]|nr:DUF4388 domain-containing protein [Vicinamibacteria bacterium]
MNGALAEGVVPQLLREIYVRRRNGWLHFQRGGERQSLQFRRGHIVNAFTNVVQERLGEILVRRGLLAEADLGRATERMLSEKRRLGEVLIDLGLIDKSGLEDAVALHVHEMLTKVFSWTEGSYSFEPEDDSFAGTLTLKLSTGELILEAVRAVRDPQVIREALGDLDRVLAPSSDPLLRFQALALAPTDGFVLSRIDGVASGREIVQMIPLPAEEAERSLFGLLSTGVIEYVAGARRPQAPAQPAPMPPATTSGTPETTAQRTGDGEEIAERRREIVEAAAGIATRTHFEVLGVPRTANEAEIKEAYFRLARRFHPDVHHASSLSDLRDSLEAVFIRLGQAYDVLRDPRRRAQYEERLGPRPAPAAPVTPQPQPAQVPRPTDPAPPAAPTAAPAAAKAAKPPRDHEEDVRVAEDALRRAAKLFEKEKYWDAIQLLEPVADRTSGRLYSKMRTLLARCYLKNPKWSRRAEEALLEVTRRDPAAADAWGLLGGIYASKQMHNRALSMYRKALELDPEHAEAASYVASHSPDDAAAGQPSPGVLKRLFRKS